VAKAELETVLKGALVFFAAKRERLIGRPPVQCFTPIDGGNEIPKLHCTHSGGVQPSYEAAHACAGQVVDWNPMVFKPLQDADVGQAQCTATFKNDPYLRAVNGGRGLLAQAYERKS
jgi:hypothetical protein